MSKGFGNQAFKEDYKTPLTKVQKLGNERMISWSPWPPANFQTKYPAFPLVMTIMLLIVGQIYISLAS